MSYVIFTIFKHKNTNMHPAWPTSMNLYAYFPVNSLTYYIVYLIVGWLSSLGWYSKTISYASLLPAWKRVAGFASINHTITMIRGKAVIYILCICRVANYIGFATMYYLNYRNNRQNIRDLRLMLLQWTGITR